VGKNSFVYYLFEEYEFPNLTDLILKHCKLKDDEAIFVSKSEHLPKLENLDVSGNKIKVLGAIKLYHSTLPSLKTLNLKENGLLPYFFERLKVEVLIFKGRRPIRVISE
jgi:hypothetical protein